MSYRIVLQRHEDGERLPMLVCQFGLPIIEPNVFALTQRGLAWRTIVKKLRAVSILISWADKHRIDLNQRIQTGILFTESEINGSLLAALKKSYRKGKVQQLTVSAKTFNVLLMYTREYLEWCFRSQLAKIAATDLRFQAVEKKQKIVLDWLEDAYLSDSSAENEVNKGLSPELTHRLLEVICPTSPDNPWKSEGIRHRNQLIILLLINFGLRPAELQTLRVEDIQFGGICSIEIKRRPHDSEDPRLNSPEVKRSGRVLPVMDNQLARLMDSYIMDLRPTFDSKHTVGTDFLFISDEGDPIAYSSITKLFAALRACDQRFPKKFSPKTLRHVFSNSMEKKMRVGGIPEKRRAEILAYLRGDTSEESQKIYTKEAVKEEALNALMAHQASIFKSIDAMKDVPF